MIKVLSTKLLETETLSYATSLDMEVQCNAFIEIVPFAFDLQSMQAETFDAVAFTSSNSVIHFFNQPDAVKLLDNKDVFSLSGRTSDELLKRNIQPTFTAINADSLARLIIETRLTRSVLHIGGNLTLDTLEQKLKAAGIVYKPLTVYTTVLHKEILVDDTFDAILFYSPSGVESFLTNNRPGNATVCCCIGATTATALRASFADAKIIFPKQPTPESMLDAISLHFKTGR
jgi:uroporphyrinogen-III synthase